MVGACRLAHDDDEQVLNEVPGVLSVSASLEENAQGGTEDERFLDDGLTRYGRGLVLNGIHAPVMSHGGVA